MPKDKEVWKKQSLNPICELQQKTQQSTETFIYYCWEKFLLRSYTRFFGKQRSNQLASTIHQTWIRTTSFEHSSGSHPFGGASQAHLNYGYQHIHVEIHRIADKNNTKKNWWDQLHILLYQLTTFFYALLPSREGSRKKGKNMSIEKGVITSPWKFIWIPWDTQNDVSWKRYLLISEDS